MSCLNYLKLGSTLSKIFVILPNLTMPLNATAPSKISGENPAVLSAFEIEELNLSSLFDIYFHC